MGLFFISILIGGVIGLIVGLANGNNPHIVTLTVATFKGSNEVVDVELTSSSFYATIRNEALNCETTERGRSIGELQYGISMTFKRWAEMELDRDFHVADKGWKCFNMKVSYKGQIVTESEWPKVTTSAMRSKKNPIARIDHVKNGPPMYGYSDYVIRKKI